MHVHCSTATVLEPYALIACVKLANRVFVFDRVYLTSMEASDRG